MLRLFSKTSLVVLPLVLAACKDATLGPETLGTVQGSVRDFETGQPVASAGVSTTPPSNAIVTGSDGSFTLEALVTGNYTITASRQGYAPNSVTIAVRDGQTSQAVIQLKQEEESSTENGLVAEVTSFRNRTTADTTAVDIEYRVRNDRSTEVPSYEVYFRIVGERQTYFAELKGARLGNGQADVGTLRKSLGGDRAQSVTVDNVWVEGDD